MPSHRRIVTLGVISPQDFLFVCENWIIDIKNIYVKKCCIYVFQLSFEIKKLLVSCQQHFNNVFVSSTIVK